ncbi:hypothetical protein EI534_13285 [Pseudomonas frederiksbergensis]|nr:hypothetical protein [Pseudomonas frederiksbergensis]
MTTPPNLFAQSLSTDQTERRAIADVLKSAIDKAVSQNEESTYFYTTTQLIDINQLVITTIKGSHFDSTHQSAKTLLRRLIANPQFIEAIETLPLEDDYWTLVNQDGDIYKVYSSPKDIGTYIESTNITTLTNTLTDLKGDIELLIKAATLTGGIVSSSERIPLINWLQFHNLDVPNTFEQVKNLIEYLSFSPLPAPEFGNYWGISDETNETILIVPEKQQPLIKQEVNTLMSRGGAAPERLINYLADSLPSRYSRVLLEENTEFAWEVLIDTEESRNFAQSCFNALGSQLSTPDKPMTTGQRSRLLVAAIMVDLDLGTDEQRKRFHDSDLYLHHSQNKNAFEAREELKDRLVAIGVNPDTATLTLQLVLAGLGPEFLVYAPSSLQVGSSGWVILHKSVLLAEHIAPGLSRHMRYEQLLELGAISPVSAEQQKLHDVITLRCIMDWASINELRAKDEENLPLEDIAKNDTSRYNAYINEIADALKAITAPPVSRKKLAKETISHETSLHPQQELFPVETSKWNPGFPRTVLELYMNNLLTSKEWDSKTGPSIFKDPDLAKLTPINRLYKNEVEKHYKAFTPGVITMIRLALSRLHRRDRVAIEYGKLALYQVLGSRFIPGHSADETAFFGIVITSWFDNELHCYELFPLQGLCLKNEDLARGFIRGVSFNEADGREFPNGDNGNFQRLTYLQHVYADNEAYFAGSKPVLHGVKRTSQLLPDNFRSLDEYLNLSGAGMLLMRFGEFDDRSQSAHYYRNSMESFNSERFKDIGNLVAEHNPPITYDQFHSMGYDKTAIEDRDEAFKKLIDGILDVIIPFKGCIEGLLSDDPKRRSGAVFSCVMDAVAVVLIFAGGVGPFLKAAASSTKLINLSRVTAGVVVSIFNPLDGVPQLVHGGARLVGKGALKLTHFGQSVTKTAVSQLRHLTNASASYDLVKALSKTGSAAEIRMTLPTVAHGRALFKDDTIETAEQIVALLANKNSRLPNDAAHVELEQLFNNAVIEATLKLKSAQDLESLIGRAALDDLFKTFMANPEISYSAARSANRNYSHILEDLSKIETTNLTYMKNYQQAVLKQDLGKAPYDAVLPDSVFNPQGFTDHAQRAGAWIVHASTTKSNNLDSIVAVLREYAGNGKSLTDPAVIKALHARVAPEAADIVRVRFDGQPYASSISGFAAMKEHLKVLDVSHEHFGKQLLGAVAGFHGLGDGNGRTARALYAISELRANRFTATTPQVDRLLHGLP